MGGFSDALEWFNLGLTCASMLQMPVEEASLRKCVSKTERLQAKKGGKADLHAKLAQEMGMDSALFYVPRHSGSGRDISVRCNLEFFKRLVGPFPIEIRDVGTEHATDNGTANDTENATDNGTENATEDGTKNGREREVPGGGRGLFAAKTLGEFSTAFVDEAILCVSYSPYLCDFCGAALPPPRQAFRGKEKVANDGSRTACETYCRCVVVLSISLCFRHV